MKRTEIVDLFAKTDLYAGKQVTVCGWVRTVRQSKNIAFMELNDGSCFKGLQVVLDKENLNNFDEIVSQNVGAAIIAAGTLVATPEMKQPCEMQACEVTVEGTSTPDYPLQKKRHSLEFLRTIQHLRPRTNTFSAAFRVRSVAAYAIHRFFQERGFVYAHTPLITTSDAEGAGEMFRVTTLPRTARRKPRTAMLISARISSESRPLLRYPVSLKPNVWQWLSAKFILSDLHSVPKNLIRHAMRQSFG